MATLKEIRNRITSVNSTMQITSAMMMVSSAKLKRAQNSIQKLRPYSEKMQELLTHITSSIDEDYGSEYKDREEIKKVLLVVITSNRGLAGAFNSTVVKAVKKIIDTTYKGVQVDILTIGKKGNDLLSKTYSIYENHSELWDSLNFKNTSEISEKLIDKFIQGEYDKIDLVYNSFKNVVVQLLKVEQFLPLQLDKEEISAKIHSDYIFESSKKEILEKLIPNTLKIQLYKAVLDSNAAEHGARMSAMQSATDNAKSLKNQLVISYNKARQASITNELIEIVSGAQALES